MSSYELFVLSEIEEDSAKRVVINDREIAIVRIGNDIYAIGDTCSHAEVSLSEGWVDPDDCAIECVAHGAMFDLETGEPLSLPATRAVPTYEVSVVDDVVVLSLGSTGKSAS